MNRIYAFLIMLTVSLSSHAELTSKMEGFIVKKDKEGKEVLKTAKRVFPGEIVLYKMTFENTSDEILKDVGITGLIPIATNFIKGSQTIFGDSKIMFSIDNGDNWSEKPMKKIMEGGEIKEIEAESYEFTNIKWNVLSFKEYQKRIFEFRVMVKN